MKTLPLLILVLTGLLTSAFAGECPLRAQGPVREAYSKQISGQMNCDYVSNVEELFQNIQKFSEESVRVNLFVQHKFDNASFDGGSIIEVPEQLIFLNEYGQEYPTTVTANLATVAHEYGHALLWKKLEDAFLKQFPKEAGFITASQEISALKIKAVLNPDDLELKNLLELKSKALLDNKDWIRFSQITTGYSELYADVVAVYNYDEKGAIMKALYYDEMNDRQFKMVQTRDFETEFTERHNVFMTEVHGMFALTRTYIGKNLWPENNQQKKVMLKKIGGAIVEEIRLLLKNKSEVPDYKIANKKLIERLKRK